MPNDMEHVGFPPAHPGEVLREDILPALGMTVSDLATHLGVTRQTLSELINERRDLSTSMAKKLGQAFKNGTRFWLAMQMQHDIWQEEHKNDQPVKPLRWDGTAA